MTRLIVRSLSVLAIASMAAPAWSQEPRGVVEAEPEKLIYAPDPPYVSLKERPREIGNPESWITPADYPLDSWRNDEEGIVQYTLDIDDTGIPTGCKIDFSDASPMLQAETCRLLMERARFEPGVNDDGEAIAGQFGYEVRWLKSEPEIPGTYTVRVTYRVDERGNQMDCQTLEKSGSIPESFARTLDRRPCPTSRSSRGAPYRDETGVPVPRQVTLMVGAVVEDIDASNDGGD